MTEARFLAIDLGAESGRAMLGAFDGERLALDEVHRFANTPLRLPTGLHWNALGLLAETQAGLGRAVAQHGASLLSMGIDAWGVDFALLDKTGALLGNPYHYRDSRTDGMLAEAAAHMPLADIFAQTGIQFMQINTLFQLLAMVTQHSPLLDVARTLLMIPDLLNYWLTGRQASERTIASTSQCLDARRGDWAAELLGALSIPTHIFPRLIPPGTSLGKLLPAVAEASGATAVQLIAPGCHDTASAVVAAPIRSSGAAYISSGTWSLLGAETPAPVINEQSRAYNFTNEGAAPSGVRLLKNIAGLWLIQECRRAWAAEGMPLAWDEITALADAAPPFTAFVIPDAHTFLHPGGMPGRIRDFCLGCGQAAPPDRGTTARVIYESLAFCYRQTLTCLEALLGRPVDTVHIVGGGSQNRLLNQFAANAMQRPVVAGPVEATAIGNILMQMLTLGYVSSLAEGRDLVRRSFSTQTYLPQAAAAWDEAYQRFLAIAEPAA